MLSWDERTTVYQSIAAQREKIQKFRSFTRKGMHDYLSRLSKMYSIFTNGNKEVFLALQENAGPEIRAVTEVDVSEWEIAEPLKQHVIGFLSSLSGIIKGGFFHRDLHDENMTFDVTKLMQMDDACAFCIIDWGMSIQVKGNSDASNLNPYYNSNNEDISIFSQVPLEWLLYEQLLNHHFQFEFFEMDTLEDVDSLNDFFSRVQSSVRESVLNTKRRFEAWTSSGGASPLTQSMLDALWIAARDNFYTTLRRREVASHWSHVCDHYQQETDNIPIDKIGAFIQFMSNGSCGALQRLDTFGASQNILQLLYRITPVPLLASGPIHDCVEILRCLVLEPHNSLQMLNVIERHHAAGVRGLWTYFTSIFVRNGAETNTTLLEQLQELLFTPEIRSRMQFHDNCVDANEFENDGEILDSIVAEVVAQDSLQHKRAVEYDDAPRERRLRTPTHPFKVKARLTR
jgi:hypothetical protein